MTWGLLALVPLAPVIALSVYGAIGIDCVRRLMLVTGRRCGMEPRRSAWGLHAMFGTLRGFGVSPLFGALMVYTRDDRRMRRDLFCMMALKSIDRVGLCAVHRSRFEGRLVSWRDCYPELGRL